jgi:hypothetical protein
LFAVTAQHLVRFSHKTLSLSNASAQGILARLDLCRMLLSALSALFGV